MAEGNFSNAILWYNQAQQIQHNNDTLKFYRAVAYTANNEINNAEILLSKLPHDVLGASNSGLKDYVAKKATEVPKDGILATRGKFDLFINGQQIASHFDTIQDISIKNSRYYLAIKNKKIDLFTLNGDQIQTIDGTPVTMMVDNWVPNAKRIYKPRIE